MPVAEGVYVPPPTFFQLPWVQNALPIVTSVVFHLGILIIGYVLVSRIPAIQRALKPTEEQIIVPESEITEETAPGGVQNVGLGGDPTRQAAQDEFTENTTPEGWANKPGTDTVPSLEGGGSGEAVTDSTIGLSNVGGSFGKGTGTGPGQGSGRGSGSGTGAGALAPFGAPGGGGLGPKSRFMGVGGNARTVVFVCDASGSMIQTFSSLKAELTKAVTNLKSIQGFNIVFFQDEKAASMDANGGLVLATPENKKKAFNFLEDVSTSGTTNPIPGLEIAFKAKPQLIYLLTDADFPDNAAVERTISRLNATKQTKINTIAFISGDAADELSQGFKDLMKKIAQDNGGQFKVVKESDLQ